MLMSRSKLLEIALNDDGNMVGERRWYEQFKTFVPPPELWSRHVGMEHFPVMSRGSLISPEIISQVSATGSTHISLIHIRTQVQEHINKTWKPNSTLFVRCYKPH